MAQREVRIALATYRRADAPEVLGFGTRGETVDVHEDDLARFDASNAPAPLPSPVAIPTEDAPAPSVGMAMDRPAGNAGLSAWKAYAIAQGKSEDDLADLSRNDIRGLFETGAED